MLTSGLRAQQGGVSVGGWARRAKGSSHGHCWEKQPHCMRLAGISCVLGAWAQGRAFHSLLGRPSLAFRLGQMLPSNAEKKTKKLYSDISAKLKYSYVATYVNMHT